MWELQSQPLWPSARKGTQTPESLVISEEATSGRGGGDQEADLQAVGWGRGRGAGSRNPGLSRVEAHASLGDLRHCTCLPVEEPSLPEWPVSGKCFVQNARSV